MKYFDYLVVSDGQQKTMAMAPGFSHLSDGDMVMIPGSGWLTVLCATTLSGDVDMQKIFRAAFGPTPRVNRIAKVKEIEEEDYE